MSLVKKMNLLPEVLCVLHAPKDCLAVFDNHALVTTLVGQKPIEQVLLFAENKKVVDEVCPKIINRLADDGILWIAYPKKTGKVITDISRDNGWATLQSAGYEPVKQVAVNDDWSALRFRQSKNIGLKLRDIPMAERTTKGVDYINRTVTLPADAEKALNKHKGVLSLFYDMSFSHKKEYVLAIEEAKKEETRIRRIEKMVDMLLKMQIEKKNKR